MTAWQRRFLQRTTDWLFTAIPRPVPDAERVSRARIIAHRGNTGLPAQPAENSLEAFDACRDLGIHGIEFDIQWTRDGVPVVLHDADTARVCGAPGIAVGEIGFDALRARHPQIPSLAEVVSRYRDSLHLMIELKTETLSARNVPKLLEVLGGLGPEADYHLLCLEPSALDLVRPIDPGAKIAVAEANTREIIAALPRHSLTRIAGHYLLITPAMRRRFAEQGIRYGVGMVPASNVLRRELALGSHWQFTNHAARLARALRRMREIRRIAEPARGESGD